jgi:hypothetical protein
MPSGIANQICAGLSVANMVVAMLAASWIVNIR